MLLIIPAVEIKGGKCVQMVQGTEGFVYSDNPIEMAKLWRKENAKTLHVTDVDGAFEGQLVNFDVIERMVKTVDIPIQLGGGLRTFEEVKKALDIGIYRVVISTMLIEEPDEAKRTLDAFGATKIVLGIDAENGIVQTRGWTKDSGLTAITVALNAKQLGFKRIVYTDIMRFGMMAGPNFEATKTLAEKSGMRITASGGVGGLEDLLKLQELEPLGVDSVVIGRALYENKFSCQGLWRMCEAGEYPYTAKV
ncbi:MAG TPA: 1-(5-phosphoribosyl)-5-[(5-phosphoribosylamino)methylideneamino]imidazole-4-carboxamide isomerase [Bacteroidota bacterium]|jgi:phosphoribosylformimino-5-aminoimidazole carboxamide ribotide isomerase|nr:1-(5-phosphoribosyl)-5-[(5-phosphoribosylamino)methylideneamino]imidazole-4-carboxamide isomerase [Bacteroidota bacterium]